MFSHALYTGAPGTQHKALFRSRSTLKKKNFTSPPPSPFPRGLGLRQSTLQVRTQRHTHQRQRRGFVRRNRLPTTTKVPPPKTSAMSAKKNTITRKKNHAVCRRQQRMYAVHTTRPSPTVQIGGQRALCTGARTRAGACKDEASCDRRQICKQLHQTPLCY